VLVEFGRDGWDEVCILSLGARAEAGLYWNLFHLRDVVGLLRKRCSRNAVYGDLMIPMYDLYQAAGPVQ
jgi:hypothetical protein